MDGIRQQTSRLPLSMRQLLTVLVNGNQKQRNLLLPIALKDVKTIADVSLSNAESVKEKFMRTQNEISEMLEVATESKGSYSTLKRQAEIERTQNELEKKALEERKARYDQHIKKLEKELDKRIKDYDEALDSMPSGWEMIGMDFVEGLVDITSAIGESIKTSLNPIGSLSGSSPSSGSGSSSQQQSQAASVQPKPISQDDRDYLRRFETLKNNLARLGERMEVKGKKTEDKTIFLEIKAYFKLFKNSFDAASEKLKSETKPFYRKVVSTINNQEKGWSGYSLDQAQKELLKLQVEAMPFATRYLNATGSSAMHTKTPYVSQLQQKPSQDDNRASRQAVANAKFNIETTSNMLETMQERYDKANDDFLKNNDKLNKILQELAKIDVKAKTFDEILELLRKVS